MSLCTARGLRTKIYDYNQRVSKVFPSHILISTFLIHKMFSFSLASRLYLIICHTATKLELNKKSIPNVFLNILFVKILSVLITLNMSVSTAAEAQAI